MAGRLHVAWIGLAAAVPFLVFGLAAPPGEVWWFVAGLLPGCLLLYAYYGTVYATIQDVVEPSSRGTAMAVYFCAMYLLGAVLGPVATGWLSDHFARRAAGADGAAAVSELHKAVGLHDAMYVIPLLNAALVVVLFAASRTVANASGISSSRLSPSAWRFLNSAVMAWSSSSLMATKSSSIAFTAWATASS